MNDKKKTEAVEKALLVYLDGVKKCEHLTLTWMNEEHTALCLKAQTTLIKNIDDDDVSTASLQMTMLKNQLETITKAIGLDTKPDVDQKLEEAKKTYYDGMRKVCFTEPNIVKIKHLHNLYRNKAFDQLLTSCDDITTARKRMATLNTTIQKFLQETKLDFNLKKLIDKTTKKTDKSTEKSKEKNNKTNDDKKTTESMKKALRVYLDGMEKCEDMTLTQMNEEHTALCLKAQTTLIKNIDDDDVLTASVQMTKLKTELETFKSALHTKPDVDQKLKEAKKTYFDGIKKVCFTEANIVKIKHLRNLYRNKAFDQLLASCDDITTATNHMATLNTEIKKFLLETKLDFNFDSSPTDKATETTAKPEEKSKETATSQ